jgi:hypothetical protein
MTTSYSSGTTPESPPQSAYESQPTGWTGWIAFAGVIMVLLGIMHALQGLVALFKDDYYLVGRNGLTVNVDYTEWGWTHLILGIVVAFAGAALWAGRMWARIVAVLLAMLSVIVNIGFLAAYPIWSTIMITMDVLIIWAVMVHGREMKSDY